MKVFSLLLTIAMLVVSTAQAERYMVVLKDKKSFMQAHAYLQLASDKAFNATDLVDAKGRAILPVADARVVSSLKNLNALIIDAEDPIAFEQLKKSANIEMIEKEIFHPAPKPVNGFKPTRAWDYSLVHAVKRNKSTWRGVGPKTPWGIHAVKAPNVWATNNFGKGSRVLVLDTGIDKNHPALVDNIEKVQDFVDGNDITDKVGHGTHVAGTVAATLSDDGFSGVAPDASILAGRVCSEDGCSNFAVAQGIEWGIEENVDVVSMSLGGAWGTPMEKKAVELAEAKGVAVVAASGNDGTPQVSFPAAFPTVVAVGAVNSNIQKADFSQWGPELDIMAPGVDVVSSVPLKSGRESKVVVSLSGAQSVVNSTSFSGSPLVKPMANELVYVGLGKTENFLEAKVAGKFALIMRGEITFVEKVQNAIVAGAAGVVIFNHSPGLIQGSLTDDGSEVAVPVVMIEKTAGDQIVEQLKAGARVTAEISTFAADYASFAGTSMATPHVSGVVALMRAANKNIKPAQIRSILKETATAMQPNGNNETGSGMINAEKAVAMAAQAK